VETDRACCKIQIFKSIVLVRSSHYDVEWGIIFAQPDRTIGQERFDSCGSQIKIIGFFQTQGNSHCKLSTFGIGSTEAQYGGVFVGTDLSVNPESTFVGVELVSLGKGVKRNQQQDVEEEYFFHVLLSFE